LTLPNTKLSAGLNLPAVGKIDIGAVSL